MGLGRVKAAIVGAGVWEGREGAGNNHHPRDPRGRTGGAAPAAPACPALALAKTDT